MRCDQFINSVIFICLVLPSLPSERLPFLYLVLWDATHFASAGLGPKVDGTPQCPCSSLKASRSSKRISHASRESLVPDLLGRGEWKSNPILLSRSTRSCGRDFSWCSFFWYVTQLLQKRIRLRSVSAWKWKMVGCEFTYYNKCEDETSKMPWSALYLHRSSYFDIQRSSVTFQQKPTSLRRSMRSCDSLPDLM